VSDGTLSVYERVRSSNREKINAVAKALEYATEEEDKIKSTRGKLNVDEYCRKKGTTLVFEKRKDKTKKDSAVCILADCSGSMGGNKIDQEKVVLVVLAEALAKVGIPFKVITFCDVGTEVVHHHYVNYKDSKKERAALMNISCDGSNFDGYSIRYALKDLMKQKAKNKLLIIISDGQPNPNHIVNDPVGDTRDAVIEARRKVKLCGIALGVHDSSYQTLRAIYHKKDDDDSFLSIKNEKDLREALPRLLKKEVKKW
jgi:nitric oxide reductase activation protein